MTNDELIEILKMYPQELTIKITYNQSLHNYEIKGLNWQRNQALVLVIEPIRRKL